ncbi:phage tail protein [Lachnospiraceae bacterium 45-P1]
MAKIGNWGAYIRFETSSRKVLTFDGFKRELSIRTAKHSLVNGGEKLEFVGKALQTASFSMTLNAMLGVRPRIIEARLIRYMNQGVVAPLVIGGRIILRQALITKMSESYDVVMKRGEVAKMTINVTMLEYN